jgi:hypothetical protein
LRASLNIRDSLGVEICKISLQSDGMMKRSDLTYGRGYVMIKFALKALAVIGAIGGYAFFALGVYVSVGGPS